MASKNLYKVARAGAARFLDSYQEERKKWPNRPGLTYEQLIDRVVLAAVQAVQEYPKPLVSNQARAAFERLVADLPNHASDVELVRRELIGSAPLPADDFPLALRAIMPNDMRVAEILRLLKKHGWGPLRRPSGVKRTAPVKLDYCPRHGPKSEFRLYHSGKRKGGLWRCWLCLQEAKVRSREQIRRQVQP